jgi:hypothetical protein
MLCCAYASSRSFNNMRMGCSDWGVGNGSRKATVAERIGSGEQPSVIEGGSSKNLCWTSMAARKSAPHVLIWIG